MISCSTIREGALIEHAVPAIVSGQHGSNKPERMRGGNALSHPSCSMSVLPFLKDQANCLELPCNKVAGFDCFGDIPRIRAIANGIHLHS